MSARPLLLGHRGARANQSIPENTLASFDQALGDGCDGFEFDVRVTADGEAVVCHDAKAGPLQIARTEGSRLPQLPRLPEVLKRYREIAFLDIELKVAGLENAVVDFLRGRRPRRGFVVSSFLPGVLRNLKRADPDVPLGLICETRKQLERWRRLPVEYVIAWHGLVRQALVDEIKNEGKQLVVWTVNRSKAMLRFAKWGVDGIISDDTRLLNRTVGIAGNWASGVRSGGVEKTAQPKSVSRGG